MKDSKPLRTIFTDTMADMTWTQVKRYADADAVVLLPIGVMEEHGPHLCLATDIYIAHLDCLGVREKLEAAGCPAVIAPPFYWGICQAGKGFVGSFNIRMETAQALLFDMLASLKDFGFTKVFGVNAHGDIAHKVAAVGAFEQACEQLQITACFPYQPFMTQHLGLERNAPCFYEIELSKTSASAAEVADVHAGDIETALVYAAYPHLADGETAKAPPNMALGDRFEAWMFGGQLAAVSPQGYLGAPASYESVDVAHRLEDEAQRWPAPSSRGCTKVTDCGC